MPSLEDEIDDLYKLPLTEFTGARNALVKRMRGADATHVRKLEKPTALAWAVNQVHWRARPLLDRVMKTGDRLRDAQLAALTGKSVDLRETTEAHRKAIADAVKEAERIAGDAGSHPAPDALTRTFEALSLAPEPPARAGRLTGALQPAGLEALAGVTPRVGGAAEEARTRAAEERKRLVEEKKRAAQERKHAAAVRRAEGDLERAKAKLREAEAALRRTQVRS